MPLGHPVVCFSNPSFYRPDEPRLPKLCRSKFPFDDTSWGSVENVVVIDSKSLLAAKSPKGGRPFFHGKNLNVPSKRAMGYVPQG